MQAPNTLRDQITAVLTQRLTATLKTIAAGTASSDYPSRVAAEVNAMRSDGLLECERRGKGPDLTYWLSTPVPAAQDAPLPKGIRSGAPAKIWRALGYTNPKTAVDLALELNCARAAIDPSLTTLHRDGLLARQRMPCGAYGYTRPQASTQQPQPASATPSAEPVAADDQGEGQAATPLAEDQPTAVHGPEFIAALAEDEDVWLAPELQYLAAEDYAMPPADPVLLAKANRMLSERLARVAHVLRGCGLPALAEIGCGEDLQMATAALAGAYQVANSIADLWESTADALQGELDNQRALNAKLEHLLESARHENDALRATLHTAHKLPECDPDTVDTDTDPVGYIMTAAKRKPRRIKSAAKARELAESAIRSGAQRAEVFALFPAGVAVRGAQWKATA